MKTTIQLCFALVIFWSLAVEAKTSSLEGFKTNVCTVINGSSYALGNVVIHEVDDSMLVVVPAPGTYYTDVTATVTEIEINGQTVHLNTSGPVTLANGKAVLIIWPAPNEVEIIDCDENNFTAM